MRFPRLAQTAALAVLAAAPIAAVSLPALAGSPVSSVVLTAANRDVAALAVTRAATPPPPHAKPASFGALPRHQPVIPSVPSQESVIAGDLMQDGAISAGALVALLIPIALYGSGSKRRQRRETEAAAAAAAERDREYRARPDHGLRADPLLEFFGPQHEPPAGLTAGRRPAVSPRYQPRPGLTGRSTLSPAFAARPMLAAPASAGSQADESRLDMAGSQAGFPGLAAPARPPRAASARSGRDPSAAASEPDAWTGAAAEFPASGQMASGQMASGQMAAGSPQAPRHAPVTGTPPWEPAPQPTSELPWAVIPGPQSPGGRHRGAGEVPPAPAAPTASAAPRSLFDPDRAEYPPNAGTERGRRTDSSGHPIYIWNPGSAGVG